MNNGFELEKRYVELRLMCDVSLMWYRKTTQLAKHSDMAPVLTVWQLQTKKDTKLAKSQQYFKQLLTDKTRQSDWNGIKWHLHLTNSILFLHKKIKDVKRKRKLLTKYDLVHISVKDFWHIVEWDIFRGTVA